MLKTSTHSQVLHLTLRLLLMSIGTYSQQKNSARAYFMIWSLHTMKLRPPIQLTRRNSMLTLINARLAKVLEKKTANTWSGAGTKLTVLRPMTAKLDKSAVNWMAMLLVAMTTLTSLTLLLSMIMNLIKNQRMLNSSAMTTAAINGLRLTAMTNVKLLMESC